MTARSRNRRNKGVSGGKGRPRDRKRPGKAQPSPRRRLWKTVGAVLALVLAISAWPLLKNAFPLRPWTRQHGTDKLNVLLITMDTTRADYLACYGRETARTPNLDRLARDGTVFTRCTTCSPQTLPSHASILTAVYPYVHGARRNGSRRLSAANLSLAETLKEAGYRTQATVSSFVLNQQFGLAQGFDVYRDVRTETNANTLHAERKGDEVRDDAIDMLRSLARDPFFLWVHFFDPHWPYESPRFPDPSSPSAYEDEITFMDTQIGLLLKELTKLGLDDQTLVVAVADHGEGLGQHEELTHLFFLYETTVHTPLVFRYPGAIPAGQRLATQVRTIDIAPTILELLGLPAWDHAQGVSLVSLVNGEEPDVELGAYSETLEPAVQFGLSPLRSLSIGQWKYILAPKPELYDLVSDPGEMRNVAAEQPDVATRMREQLRALIAAAPPPAAEAEVSVELGAADVARLQSLGYAASATMPSRSGSLELDSFEPRGGNPRDYAPYIRLRGQMEAALRKGDHERSERLVRQLIDAMPDVPHLQVDVANVLLSQGRVDAAMKALGRAVSMATNAGQPPAEVMPNLPLVQVNLARALGDAGRLDEANAAFEQALEMDPGSVGAHRAYGSFLIYAVQRYQKAAYHLAIALKQSPNDVKVLHDLGTALMALGQSKRADDILTRALTLEPRNHRVLQALGVLRLQQDRLEEAEAYFRKTLDIEPESPEARAALKHVRERIRP